MYQFAAPMTPAGNIKTQCVVAHFGRQDPAEELEQTEVITRTVKDAMHVHRTTFDFVEYQVVLDHEVSVSQSGQVFFLWDPTKRGLL